MEPFLMKPKIDFAFKEIMNDETALRGFLSAVLGLKAEEIQSVKIQNTDLTTRKSTLKYSCRSCASGRRDPPFTLPKSLWTR